MSTSFEQSFQKALGAVGGDKRQKGYLKLSALSAGSEWERSLKGAHKAWTRVPMWGTAKSGIQGSAPRVREIVDHLLTSSSSEYVATPREAAQVIAWAKAIPGWRPEFLTFGNPAPGNFSLDTFGQGLSRIATVETGIQTLTEARATARMMLRHIASRYSKIEIRRGGKEVETIWPEKLASIGPDLSHPTGGPVVLGAGGPYSIKLGAFGNPDFRQPHDIGLPIKHVKVKSLKEAVEKGRAFITNNKLGGGNWVHGAGYIFDKRGKHVAQMSYNGRLWEPGPWRTPEIKL